MGEGMPYHLEKGPLLRIIERNLNGSRATMQATLNTIEASIANEANGGDPASAASLAWHTGSAAWNDPAFDPTGPRSGGAYRDRIITEWFGYEHDPAGGWRMPNPPPPTTGYWIGYRGDVHGIVRRAFAWAIELALGTGARADADPWPIELFWKCPAPWFEAWVVSRKAETTSGLVTVILVSPAHRAAVVADSPIAHSPTASKPGVDHPVPSWQDDYEQLGAQHPLRPNRPVVKPATDRDYATWVVSQAEHDVFGGVEPVDRLRQVWTAIGSMFTDWWIPQLAMWEGQGEVVVVAPSMAAGGVKHDGKV
jgi:hypothetical protein